MANTTYNPGNRPGWHRPHPATWGSVSDRPGWHLPAPTASGPPASGASAASSGAATGAGGPPVDPGLIAQQNAANTSIALGGAWDTYQQGQIGASYGNLDNPAADLATNPYSQAALALTHYNNSTRGTTNSYAASGQLYAGSLQSAQEANLSNYNQGLDSLKKGKQAALDTLTKGALDRYSTTGATLDAGTIASLIKALGG